MILVLGLGGLLVQRFFKPHLDRDQYYYVKDITMLASWAMVGIWSGSGLLKWVIIAGMGGLFLGFCQKMQRSFELRPLFLFLGLLLALFGPRINFIGMPGGVFLYLPQGVAVVLSALWYSLFPLVLQEVDQIPGLGGSLLFVGWLLMSLGVLISSPGWNEVIYACLAGLVLMGAFWSRYLHVYGRLGEQMTSMWGMIMGGITVLGASKGLAFSALFLMPLGLFLVPIVETSLKIVGTSLVRRQLGSVTLYRALMNRGVDHPMAVYMVSFTCLCLGMLGFSAQRSGTWQLSLLVLLGIVLLGGGLYTFLRRGGSVLAHSRRPRIFGVHVDNVTLNYVLGRVRAMVSRGESCLICTLDALGALRSRDDSEYREVLNRSDLVLPDGKGLLEAFRILGNPLSERIPGVEFVDHLCRLAASEGWKVFLLGGKPGVAELAAQRLVERHPGLVVAGCMDGYFPDSKEAEVVKSIASSGAKVLFVGLGVPRQEKWLFKVLKTDGCLAGVVGVGIGGSFDVISGRLKRAPLSWQRLGLEWLYRTIQEPWRIRRIARLPKFLLLVLLEKLLGPGDDKIE
ncbi:MAG: WecB/TagA/CpsF family glycosyltransferase [Thermanaerothrix sp.]|nr:WecB/TagA/CpsF family glycosyltransferase [Thermanaerothrix sp.]